MASGDTREQNYLDIAAHGQRADLPSETCCETRTQTLTREVAERVISLEEEVEWLENNPDVADIVATYTDLENYDTSTLTDKDIIRVLTDSTHDNNSTYYRYNKSSDTFTYIGSSKTYSNFTGATSSTAGTNGLVPAPAAGDEGKFLKGDGTWDTAGGGGGGDSVYSTKTTSNSATGGAVYIGDKNSSQEVIVDPSSADNHYKYFWALPSSTNGNTYGKPMDGSVNILGSANGTGTVSIGANSGMNSYAAAYSVRIGNEANAGSSGVAVGSNSGTTQDNLRCVCLGAYAKVNTINVHNSVALGYYANATRSGEVNVGSSDQSYGYNSTAYRVIGGVYDGQDAHDVATVGQINAVIDAINTALNTNISHIGS